MLRISVVASCAAMLAVLSALPAFAAASRTHEFSIPGVYGVRAWGNYSQTGIRVRVSVCVEDTAPSVYGAAAVGLAFDSSYRHHDNVGTVTIGDDHTRCHTMTTRYTSHLVVEALSGYPNGKLRQRGKPRARAWWRLRQVLQAYRKVSLAWMAGSARRARSLRASGTVTRVRPVFRGGASHARSGSLPVSRQCSGWSVVPCRPAAR